MPVARPRPHKFENPPKDLLGRPIIEGWSQLEGVDPVYIENYKWNVETHRDEEIEVEGQEQRRGADRPVETFFAEWLPKGEAGERPPFNQFVAHVWYFYHAMCVNDSFHWAEDPSYWMKAMDWERCWKGLVGGYKAKRLKKEHPVEDVGVRPAGDAKRVGRDHDNQPLAPWFLIIRDVLVREGNDAKRKVKEEMLEQLERELKEMGEERDSGKDDATIASVDDFTHDFRSRAGTYEYVDTCDGPTVSLRSIIPELDDDKYSHITEILLKARPSLMSLEHCISLASVIDWQTGLPYSDGRTGCMTEAYPSFH